MEKNSINPSFSSFILKRFIASSIVNFFPLYFSVKAVQNIVFQTKESKKMTDSDADVEGLMKELINEKII